jgi:ABC-type glycerol-3-phosphate transport system substrate-binding protein
MTGRSAGYCAGYPGPGYANPGYGRGFGRGWGRGFGRGYWGRGRGFWWRDNYPEPYYSPDQTKEEEKTYLEKMVKGLEEEIKAMRERIREITKEK